MHFVGIARYLIQTQCCQLKPKNNQLQLHLFHHRNRFQCYSMFVEKLKFEQFHYLKSICESNSFLLACKNILGNIPLSLKNHSVNIIKTCISQCEFVMAHRIRRSQQMFSLYTKLWDEMALKQLVNKMRKQLVRKGKNVLLGASIVPIFNWEKERISDDEILRYAREMQLVEFLRFRRDNCMKAKVAEGTVKEACDCPVCSATDSEWESFVDKDDLVVWKREDDSYKGQGLYSYKVYGKYDDVTAVDFLEAQIDLDYRRIWDKTAVMLYLVDSEPETQSDVIYWESKWPKMFSNRDYVFKRRFKIDKKEKLITIVNRSTEHQKCPPRSSKQRVTEYWSYMVIKPITELNKPGIEFSLTYFDNPGLNVPSALSLWVTVTAMPDYLRRLRMASLEVTKRQERSPERNTEPPSPPDLDDPCEPGPVPNTPSDPTPETTYLDKFRAGIFLF